MRDIVIVAATRTAIGKFNGSLQQIKASQLGATVIKALIDQTGIDISHIDEVILGQVLAAGEGQNPARQAALAAGLPNSVPAMTINKVCGSGLKAVQLAAQAIKCGDSDIVIAGGQENMSASAHILPGSRQGQRMGHWPLEDSMIKDGLWCAINDYHMGVTAENIATEYDISREQQDHLAVSSQNKAESAQKQGKFKDEITAVNIPQRQGAAITFLEDEGIRKNAQYSKINALSPAFKKEGSVTAGNASSINDGAAAVLVMSAEKADQLGLKPMATIKAYASAGVDPAIMGTGPIPATQKCLQKAGWQIEELDLIEANEAFAAQALCVNQSLQFPQERVNVNGGAIALGHPIGASGCRILVTLLHEMRRRNARKGLATLCIGGGQGVALAVEMGITQPNTTNT